MIKICTKNNFKNCKNILNDNLTKKSKAIIRSHNAIIIKINTICFVMMKPSDDVKNIFNKKGGYVL